MRKALSRIFLLTGVLIIAGCIKSPQVQLQIDESVAALIDSEINCADVPEGTCAIDSEFHELAEHAFANSTTETPIHYVSILNNGQDALIARLHLIRSAKKTLELQTYIWTDDEVGRLVFFEFLQAARRGVKVRIIVDQFTMGVEPELLARLATAHVNLEIGFYNPIFTRGKTTPLTMTTGGLFSFRKYNQRMHNKVFIVYGQIGIVGGRNIENSYYDFSTTYNFKDRDVLVIGPAVLHMHEIFERYWNDKVVVKAIYLVDVGQEVIKLGKRGKPTLLNRPDISLFSDIDTIANQYSIFEDRPTSKPNLVGKVQYTADLPGKPLKNEEGYKDSSYTMREVISGVQKSLTVQTPYFHLSRTATKMLKKLRKNNPDLKLTVSSNSLAATDLLLNYAITLKQKRSIIKDLKVNLYEFKPYPEDVGTFRLYEQCPYSKIIQPLSYNFCSKLRSVIRANMFRHPSCDKKG
jgi:phosphatidylserine/phosphatidylglycerophosphate/cardiolipin synthase-like enzyme